MTTALRVGLPEDSQGLCDNPEDPDSGAGGGGGAGEGIKSGRITKVGKKKIVFGDLCVHERTVTVTCF